MVQIQAIIGELSKVQHGFSPIKSKAAEIVQESDPETSHELAEKFYGSEVHQARMLATIIWGHLAAKNPDAFAKLEKLVSNDSDWRVQEMLAMAFDQYCRDLVYEQALPALKKWLMAENPNLRRAVSEGLRIWTQREYFKQHPEAAIKLLSKLKADDSEYARKSAGNALRDISRFHKDLVAKELAEWDISNKNTIYTYKLASKFLN